MANFFSKLKDGLKKTRNSWFDAIFGEDRISDEFFEELEESLILAQMLLHKRLGFLSIYAQQRTTPP